MTAYFIRRLLLMIPTFLGVTMIAFMITRFLPGGPLEQELMRFRMAQAESGGGGSSMTQAGGELPQEALDELKKAFDLDKPAPVAYKNWLTRMIFDLDMGNSYKTREKVWDAISARFPISIFFGLTGFVLAYGVSVPLGIAKAIRHSSRFDFISSALVFIGYSIPGWAMGALLLVFFASGQHLDWFPLGGFESNSYDDLPSIVKKWEDIDDVSDDFGSFDREKMSLVSKVVDRIQYSVLPVFCYMIGSFATLTVLMKNSLMDNVGQDYVRTAFAKGLSPRRVIFYHALRNSLIPIATGLGHALSVIMAGSYLIEKVFNIKGIGLLGFNAIVGYDYPLVMGILSINIMLMLFGNILSDFLYALIDPRVRFE
ncbi:MAG: peptide ABC transporter permease [Planctomycetaceae bacterium]|nr:peptide ABC transporter permease [Planctomycetaceae bacterium]